MDTATITAIVQAIVTIVTTLSGVWAIFNKKTQEMQQNFKSDMDALQFQIKQSNIEMSKKLDSSVSSNKIKL